MRIPVIAGVALVLTVAFTAAPASAQAGRHGTTGTKAPDFALETHDGKSLTLSKLEGKRGVVLVFFATWCPYCMTEVPRIKRFVEEARGAPVLVYGVNLKQPKRTVEKFVESRGVNYRILLDLEGEVARKYRVQGIPLVVGIDAEGVVRYRDHAMPKRSAEFIRTLTAPLADK